MAIFILVKPFLPILDYVVNYDYIVKELCENKDKPAMNCNGKCHLMKELSKASDDDKQTPLEKKQNAKPIAELFFATTQGFIFGINKRIVNPKIETKYSDDYSFLSTSLIFHPPIS